MFVLKVIISFILSIGKIYLIFFHLIKIKTFRNDEVLQWILVKTSYKSMTSSKKFWTDRWRGIGYSPSQLISHIRGNSGYGVFIASFNLTITSLGKQTIIIQLSEDKSSSKYKFEIELFSNWGRDDLNLPHISFSFSLFPWGRFQASDP